MRELAASARSSQPVVINGKVTTQAEIDKSKKSKNQPPVKTVSSNKPIQVPTQTVTPQQQQTVDDNQKAVDNKPMIANLSDLAVEVPTETVEQRNMREKNSAIDAAIERVKNDIKGTSVFKERHILNGEHS